MQHNSSETFHPTQSRGTWWYVALALLAHGTLLLAFMWDAHWTDQIINLRSLFGYQADLPKLIGPTEQPQGPQLNVTDIPKSTELELASLQPTSLAQHFQAPKPHDMLVMAKTESSSHHENILKQQKSLEDQHREARLQKIKAQITKEQTSKKEQDIAQKKREKERQMLATHIQMNSKRLTENQKNTNAQANKEAHAKRSAENLSEAYRQENIRRMQRLVGSN